MMIFIYREFNLFWEVEILGRNSNVGGCVWCDCSCVHVATLSVVLCVGDVGVVGVTRWVHIEPRTWKTKLDVWKVIYDIYVIKISWISSSQYTLFVKVFYK